MAKFLELCCRGIEIFAPVDLERGRLFLRVALEVAQRVLLLVRLEIDRALYPLADLQPEIIGGEQRRAFEVARAEPHIGDVLEFDHASTPAANSGISLTVPQEEKDSGWNGKFREGWVASSPGGLFAL